MGGVVGLDGIGRSTPPRLSLASPKPMRETTPQHTEYQVRALELPKLLQYWAILARSNWQPVKVYVQGCIEYDVQASRAVELSSCVELV
jgi:hypothetical protein